MSRRPPLLVMALLALLAPVAATVAVAGSAPTGPVDDARPSVGVSGGPGGSPALQTETRAVTVELVGGTATDTGLGPDARSTLAAELDLDADRVAVRNGTVEVLANRSADRVASAIRAAGGTAEGVERGVTNRTRDRAVEVVRERIVLAGLDGNTTVAAAGDSRLRVRTTASVGRVRSLVAEGRVELVATVPTDGRSRNVTVVDETGFDNVGEAQPGRASQPPRVPVTMSDSAAANFSESMRTLGFTSDEGIGGCRYEEPPAEPGYCLQTVVDGEVVYAASMSAGLADLLRSGEFQEDPEFVLTAQNVSRAEELSLTLRSGSLPGPTRVVGTATVTPSVTPTDERSAATGGNDGGPTTGDGPAPGPVLSLAAVVAAGLAWGRRQSDS